MTEEKKAEPAIFDAEWEVRKLRQMILDVVDMIADLKSKDKSLSARISRLRIRQIEDEGEEEGVPRERERERPDIESMSIEERAVLYSELLDRLRPTP